MPCSLIAWEFIQVRPRRNDGCNGGSLATRKSMNSLTPDPGGAVLLGVKSNRSGSPTTNSLVAIDPTLGAITVRGALPGDVDGLAQDPPAPPTIGKAFGAGSIPLNGTTTLTFTLTNPNAGTSLTGVGFTDTLPAGLVVFGAVAEVRKSGEHADVVRLCPRAEFPDRAEAGR